MNNLACDLYGEKVSSALLELKFLLPDGASVCDFGTPNFTTKWVDELSADAALAGVVDRDTDRA